MVKFGSSDIKALLTYDLHLQGEEDVNFCKNIGLNGLKVIEEIANKKKKYC